jgi:RNA polymerase sigma factor (sigma-70 family)
MKHLDDASHEVIHLKYIESKSYQEISQQLWFSEEAIRKRLSRALYRLRKLLS